MKQLDAAQLSECTPSRVLVGAAVAVLLLLGLLTAGVSLSTYKDGYAQDGSGQAEPQSKSETVRARDTVTLRGMVWAGESGRENLIVSSS
jgi:hypothetical protein